MYNYDKPKMVSASVLSEYLNIPIDTIERNRERIAGTFYIRGKWLYNINLICWLINNNLPVISRDGAFRVNRIRNHQPDRFDYASVSYYKRRIYFHHKLNSTVGYLNTYRFEGYTCKELYENIDALFRSSLDNRRKLYYDYFITNCEHLQFFIERLDNNNHDDYFRAEVGGGDPHKETAKLVLRHIVDQYGKMPLIEEYHNNKRVDIYDKTRGAIYEIGDTDPSDLIRHLEDLDIYKVYIVPFQPHDDNYVFGVSMQRGPTYESAIV